MKVFIRCWLSKESGNEKAMSSLGTVMVLRQPQLIPSLLHPILGFASKVIYLN